MLKYGNITPILSNSKTGNTRNLTYLNNTIGPTGPTGAVGDIGPIGPSPIISNKYGTNVTNDFGNKIIIFDTPYINAPNVVTTILGQVPAIIIVDAITINGFTVYTYDLDGSLLKNINFNWQSI